MLQPPAKKNNDGGPIEQANKQNEDALRILPGKKYIWDSYYSIDSTNVKTDLISNFGCATKDTMFFGSLPTVTRLNGGANEISGLAFEQYCYPDANSCWVNSQYNSRKNPSRFTYLDMGSGVFERPFPINQVILINYPSKGVPVGFTNTNTYSSEFRFGSINDARLVLYYDGSDGKRYYIELRRL